MSNTKRHVEALKKIPKKKWQAKVWSSVIGAAAVAGAVLMKDQGWFPDWFLIGLIAFGGYCIAGDLVRGFLGFLPAAIKDIKAAISK